MLDLIVYVCGVLHPAAVDDCLARTPVPIVQLGPYIELAGWAGFFSDRYPDYLFLSLGQDPRQAEIVLVHELTHFVDYYATGFEGMDSCEVEGRAYAVSNRYAIEHGLSDFARWNWRDFYPGCELTEPAP
jgi:hypothetical protein